MDAGQPDPYIPNEREERMEALLREGVKHCVLNTKDSTSREETLDWLERARQFLGPEPTPASAGHEENP